MSKEITMKKPVKLSLIIAALGLINAVPLIILIHLQGKGYDVNGLPLPLSLFLPITMFACSLGSFIAGWQASLKHTYKLALKILLADKTIQARVNVKTGQPYVALTSRGVDSDNAMTDEEVIKMANEVVDNNLRASMHCAAGRGRDTSM
jgi:hypothetical protein